MAHALRLLVIALLAAAWGCPGNGTASEAKPVAPRAPDDAQPAARPRDPTVELLPVGREAVSVRVEVVRTEEDVRRGLMFRTHLDDDAGMLFLFDHPQQLTFWMRNTFISLDMIFIEPDLTVLGVVENAEPQTDTRRMVPGQSQYVLEVNAGFSRRHGVAQGTKVRFQGVTLPASEETSP